MWLHPDVNGTENPCPGTDGATTWKASRGSPPYAAGSVKGPSTSRNSATDPGHPCVTINGKASGSGDRTCRKWIVCPSISVVYCGKLLSSCSAFRQSYDVRQYSARSYR